MSNSEAIEVIEEMATELNISPNSTQEKVLLIAINTLQIQYNYTTKPI